MRSLQFGDLAVEERPDESPAPGFEPVFFTSESGQPLRIDFAVEPVIQLRQNSVTAQRIEPTLTHVKMGRVVPSQNYAKLSDADMATIDHAVFEAASNLLPKKPIPSNVFAIVPASFRTLGGRRGRNALANMGGLPPARVKAGVIAELADIDRGTPAGRLVEVAGLVATLTRGVFVRLTPGKEMMAPLEGGRFQGLTFDAGALPQEDGRIVQALLDVAGAARAFTSTLVAQGLSCEGFRDVAEVAGFSHVAFRDKAAA